MPFLDLIRLLTGQCYIHVGKQPVFGYMFYYLFSYLILFYTLENIINHVYQNTSAVLLLKVKKFERKKLQHKLSFSCTYH